MGLSFALLRAVQLLQCCHGWIPSLFIQVKMDTNLSRYLRRLGFTIVKLPDLSNEISALAKESPGYA